MFSLSTKVGTNGVLFGKPRPADGVRLAVWCHCAPLDLGISLGVGTGYRLWQVSEERQKLGWMWPLGLMATGLAGAAVLLFRGCWHSKMSWPVRAQSYSYQVCLGCGIKRLFDEKDFRAYGPYNYDLDRLMAWDRAQQNKARPEVQSSQQRPA
jgi:hypothetical protein